jgi:hypothetical protein
MSVFSLVRDILVRGFALTLVGILLIFVLIATIITALYWPFYSYDQLNSYIDSVQKEYPIEVRLNPDSKSLANNYILMAGKLFCAAKLINQQSVLIEFIPKISDVSQSNKFQVEDIYQSADKYLCPFPKNGTSVG